MVKYFEVMGFGRIYFFAKNFVKIFVFANSFYICFPECFAKIPVRQEQICTAWHLEKLADLAKIHYFRENINVWTMFAKMKISYFQCSSSRIRIQLKDQ